MEKRLDLRHSSSPRVHFLQNGLLGIEQFSSIDIPDIHKLLNLADDYFERNRRGDKKSDVLSGCTQVNLFFENSTRTLTSFELAGKRLGADVIGMDVTTSSMSKGESLQDTIATLNAMHPDLLVVRHNENKGINTLAEKVSCAVINAGDGTNEHPTQALLDAMVIRRNLGEIKGKRIAICGDISHSRVARSNVKLLALLGAKVNVVPPPALYPAWVHEYEKSEDVKFFEDMRKGLAGCDIVMTLRLQLEREKEGEDLTAIKEQYFEEYGLDLKKLAYANEGAFVMHPGPMNRGVEIASEVADHPTRSLISQQVEAGVALRQAVLETIISSRRADNDNILPLNI